jgi:4-amino-4-deoxy-L-arabinose transferase-like glycosyltransferase
VIARILVALLIVTALVAPWLYLVQQRESAFLGTSVSHDVFTRIATPLEGHRGPPGYHLALSFATFLPWSPLLPMAIVFGWKRRADARVRFALAAVIGPWLMFELVSTKLPHYMLPAFPPLAFLAADAVVRWTRGEHDELRRRAFVMAAGVVGLVMLAIGAGAVVLARRFGEPTSPAGALAAVGVLFAGCVVACFVKRKVVAGLLALGTGMSVFYVTLFAAYLPRVEFLRLSDRVAEVLHRHGATEPGETLMLDYKEPSLAFYQGGTIRESSAMSVSRELLAGASRWLVITDEVWRKTPDDVRARLEVVEAVRGVAYADGGRVVDVLVVRERAE